jgi:cytochrome c5
MSDAHNEHESLIKTPKQLIAAVLAGFLIPIIVIVLLVQYVGSTPKTGAGSNAQSPEAVAARIKPVADEGYTLVDAPAAQAAAAAPAASAPDAMAPAAAAPAATAPAAPAKLAADAGKKTFEAACIACHGAGIAGAPKFGDKAAWAPRIKQGKDVLYTHAIKGFQGKAGMMPAKGGSAASDEEVKAAVDYMVAAGK